MNDADRYVEELPALLHGELTLAELRSLTAHLRACASCQRELVEVAVGVGAVARVQRQGLLDTAAPTLPALAELPPDEPADLHAARGHRRRLASWRVLAAAAVAALIVLGGAVLLNRGSSSPNPPDEQLALQAVGTRPVRGEVTMSGKGASRTMVVSTDLAPVSARSYYEVWLLDTTTNRLVAVGVLPPSGTAHFTLPSDLLSRYDAVDLSLQPDNGQTTHSSDSVLRAKYA